MIIPARNEAGHIGAALASVAAQTWPSDRVEAVVVDNGSVDGTGDVVRAFMPAAPGLRVRLVEEPVPGAARARNRGAAQARGTCLVFLDADSRMAPDLLDRIAARRRAGYAAGSIRVVADSSDLLDRGFFGLIEFGKQLFGIHAQMCYCERELFWRTGGFDETLHLAEDRDLLTRLRAAGVPLARVGESWIATSPRRLRSLPLRLGMLTTLSRWALAHWGIGRRWRY